VTLTTSLLVTGNITLGGALNLTLDATPQPGDRFTIIANGGGNPVNGIFAGLPEGAILKVGGFQFRISYHGGAGNDVVLTDLFETPLFITAVDAGSIPEVRVLNAQTNTLQSDFLAYNVFFTGGVRVALGDVNGDGIPDYITAAGPGGGSEIKVFSGRDG